MATPANPTSTACAFVLGDDGLATWSDIHADAEYRAAMARIYVARAVEAALAASA